MKSLLDIFSWSLVQLYDINWPKLSPTKNTKLNVGAASCKWINFPYYDSFCRILYQLSQFNFFGPFSQNTEACTSFFKWLKEKLSFKLHNILYISVAVPVWPVSRLQLSAPAAASPLPCCDSRLVHQTAGPHRASANPGAADAGSVRKSHSFSLSEIHMQLKQQRILFGTAVTDPLTILQLAVSSTGEGPCWARDFQLQLQLCELCTDKQNKTVK